MGTRFVLGCLMACALTACGSATTGEVDEGDESSRPRPSPAQDVREPQTPLTSGGGLDSGAGLPVTNDGGTGDVDAGTVARDAGTDVSDARSDAHDSGAISDANAPDAADTGPSFPCSDNGRFAIVGVTAVDSTTGLTWERATSAPVSLSDAVRRCEGLGTGWRVPSLSELQSIHRVATGCVPEIDWSAFPSTPHASTNQEDDSFWSSTPDTRPAVPANAFSTLHFGTGEVSYAVTTTRIRVKCVR